MTTPPSAPDLVARLREYTQERSLDDDALCALAAAEIERLTRLATVNSEWKASVDVELERLRAGLEKYGSHTRECGMWPDDDPIGGPCNCGLDEARRGAGEKL